MKKLLSIIAVACLVFVGCSNDNEELDQELLNADVNRVRANDNNAFTTFTVTIENLDGLDGCPNVLSPGIYVVQKKNTAPLFVVGEPDFGEGLEAIAEDGVPTQLNESLNNDPEVRSHGAFAVPVGGDGPAPILPGGSYQFTVTAKYKDHLNLATMFVQSNDLFIGPDADGIPLFNGPKDPISGDITMYMELWDAGTEVNEEPCVGPNQAPRQPAPNTGADENGVVRLVDDVYTYPEVSDVIRVTITPQ